MCEPAQKTGMLHTITLSVKREAEEPGSLFSFVFGIGSAGLTPFEYELAGKKCGEEISICVPGEKITEYFGHIMPPVPNDGHGKTVCGLNMKIEKIEKASAAELVRAMSDMIGGCGCGCGGHGLSSPECPDCHDAGCSFRGSISGCAH